MSFKENSFERGCSGKIKLGKHYTRTARRLSLKHDKSYGVYVCSVCGNKHLTTKLDDQEGYRTLLFVIKREGDV